MIVEPLDNRRRNYRIAADIASEGYEIIDRLFSADALGRSFEGVVNGKLFEKIQRRRPFVDGNAGKLAYTNSRVWQRRDLRTRDEVEAVFVEILIYENLGALFRRDSLLNTVGKHLAIRQVRSYVHVSRCNEAVGEIVDAFHVKTRPTLIRMSGICFMSQHPILNDIEPGIQKRTRIGPRA